MSTSGCAAEIDGREFVGLDTARSAGGLRRVRPQREGRRWVLLAACHPGRGEI